ncbi:Gfo/Idh/MocA family protein [Microbacterium sp. E-13]|uniref:Gfo/Idh/MocA family protein n=1 Tax=Microbacterium sp. E-13 TaxID=3404048 RepID=UPI003CF74275
MPYGPETPAHVAIIGAGNIARRYVEGMGRYPQLRLIGCADVVQPMADALAADAGIRAYTSVDELVADPDVDIVVNITPPTAHAAVTSQALAAGKHVYVEKPIAATVAESKSMLAAAAAHRRTIGSAPDTFLGSAGQTARAAIDRGVIGEPIGATAFVTHSKAETWHPDPTFLFQPGGGPALDLGPYYLTTLVNMLGSVAAVAGFTRVGAPVRPVTAPDRRVDTVEVTTPTHWGATLKFRSGTIGTLLMSFDVWDSHLPKIEVYGTAGTLTVPDPNEFDGDVTLRLHSEDDWRVLEPVIAPSGAAGTPAQYLRGMGVADLAAAIDGAPHRASAALATHVLEVIEAIQVASDSQSVVHIDSTVPRPAPMERAVPS